MLIIHYRKILLLSGLLIVIASLGIIGTLGLKFGIDFTGGSLTEVAYGQPLAEGVEIQQMAYGVAPEAELEEALNNLPIELGGFSVRQTQVDDGREGYIVRTRDLTEEERIMVSTTLSELKEDGEIVRFTTIGPVIGEELKDKAIWAIGLVCLMIICYVALVFRGVSYPVGSWVYGGITILALVHDVLVPTAVMSLLGHFAGVEIDVLFIMALLAILGYSVNDTIVVFDRVRENLTQFRQEKKVKTQRDGLEVEEIEYILTKSFGAIVGGALQQSFLRSINTSVTTAIALAALYIVGGTVTTTFALILLVGVAVGAYSSLFLASPLLVYWAERKGKI